MGRPADITGQRFGKLTAIRPTGETQERYRVWECACDCGNTAFVSVRHLKRGQARSCGCIPPKRRYYGREGEDITGQRFGMLTALERAGHAPDGKTMWLCRCECGNLKAVRTGELKSGRVRSCGCLKSQKVRDLTGQRIGRLTVINKTDKRDYKGSVIWHCVCDCGNEADFSEDNLMHGSYQSCGCLRRECKEHIGDQLTFVDGTCIEWLSNRKWRSDNTSGCRGVYRMPGGRFRVDIGFKGKRYALGTFSDMAEAARVRRDAEEVLHEGFVRAYREYSDYAGAHPSWAAQNPFVYEVERDGHYMTVTHRTMIPAGGADEPPSGPGPPGGVRKGSPRDKNYSP